MKYKVFMDITVSKILYGIEAETDEQAQAIALEKVKNEPYYYAAHADGFVKAEVEDFDKDEEDDPLAKYSDDFKEAIQYIKDNRPWTDAQDARAMELVNLHFDIPSDILVAIADLMEEYGEDHDLQEGWWLNEADEDDIFMMLK